MTLFSHSIVLGPTWAARVLDKTIVLFVDWVKIQEPLAAANITNYILTSKYNQVKKEVKPYRRNFWNDNYNEMIPIYARTDWIKETGQKLTQRINSLRVDVPMYYKDLSRMFEIWMDH